MRIVLLGATGTIGRAVLSVLVARGHEIVCFARGPVDLMHPAVRARIVDVGDPASLERDGFRGETFDAVVSCMASRTGAPLDAWAIDHAAHLAVLSTAKAAGVRHFVLLSAICVQRPILAFQHAKRAFEAALIASGMVYSIVRPTAYFKSLSGQIKRVQQGKPFLVFGDGDLTSCKPISDNDLARFMVDCLTDPKQWYRILPIGGPGEAITPRAQGVYLFERLGLSARFRHVPVGMLDGIVAGLSVAGRVVPRLAAKAELARIGRYYATESMLVFDDARGRYDAAATPSTGCETLFDYYDTVLSGDAAAERGAHAVF